MESVWESRKNGALYKTLGDILKQRFKVDCLYFDGNKELAKGWDSKHLVAFLSIMVL